MSDPNSDPSTIAILADILVSDGNVPLNFGGNTFEIRYQAGYVTPDSYDQTEEAINVITTVTSFALSPTGSALIQGQGEIVWINVTNDPYGQDSGATRVLGQPIVNINTTQVGDLYRAADGTYQEFNLQHIVNHELVHIFGDPEDTPNHNGITNAANGETYGGPPRSNDYYDTITQQEFCFLGDTAISMWPLDPTLKPDPDGVYDQDEVRALIWTKPIEDIRVKDVVVAHDKNGNLVPDIVSRTFQNRATHILDFWGTGVTPGHAYLCGDGKHEGHYIPLIDILRQDRAIVLENGIKVRASTNYPVGSLPDQFLWVLAGHDDGQEIQVTDKRQVRIGTRMIAPDGSDDCILDILVQTYGPLSENGFFENGTNVRDLVVHWPYGDKIPNPEDYILRRSNLTLEEIYTANEWEQIGTRMPPPSSMVGFNPRVGNRQAGLVLQPSKPMPNIPPAFADHPDVPTGPTKLNRKKRKSMEARKRKTAPIKMRKLH